MKRLLTQTLMSALLVTGFSLQGAQAALMAQKATIEGLKTNPRFVEAVAHNQAILAEEILKETFDTLKLNPTHKLGCSSDELSLWNKWTRQFGSIYTIAASWIDGKETKIINIYADKTVVAYIELVVKPTKDSDSLNFTIYEIETMSLTAGEKYKDITNNVSSNSFTKNPTTAFAAALYPVKENRTRNALILGTALVHMGLMRYGKYENGLLDALNYLNSFVQPLAKVWS